ncbi:MAG: sugar ABC transporter permease [Lachnospiraceae bacterium]|nr:sugar ABC transporter permease [Lachnospiraceae bacterium]
MKKESFGKKVIRDFKKNKQKYLLILPVLIFFALFHYKPMYGLIIAFKRFRPTLGIMDSPWIGFQNFERFFNDIYFFRLIRNTFTISFLSLLFSFPMPIFLALLLNEVRREKFKKTVQTITYMPHFIAMVVLCGMVTSFCQTNGIINVIIEFFGGTRTNLLLKQNYFYPIYIISEIWKNIGWDSIIFLAALSGIDQEQYEAAKVDGAGRIKQMLYITLPGLLPTISILLVLRMGGILNVGYEKILLLYQPSTYEVADVISTYTYRKGLIDADYSYSAAIGMFNSVINIFFLTVSNKISKKAGQSGLY